MLQSRYRQKTTKFHHKVFLAAFFFLSIFHSLPHSRKLSKRMRAIVTFLCVAALLVLAVAGLKAGNYPFPTYKQCDPRWGNDTMGIKGNGWRSTICGEGCAMSSTAMALAGLGVKMNGAPITPATLNTWLIANQGYVCIDGDCDNLVLTAPERLSPVMSLIGEDQKPAFKAIATDIANERIIHVAHVRNNSHFVLLVGAVPGQEAFYVHDPFYNVTVYPYANITDIIRSKINVYPVYKQCDPRWGSNEMGTDGDTICQVGCLMSSISSALAGTGINIANTTVVTPATMNTWLRGNGGYVSGTSDLQESVVPKLSPSRISWPSDGMHTTNDLPFATIKEYIDRKVPRIVIANVMDGGHFVLVVGYRADGDTLVVNDSGFNRNTYSYSKDVVGWRIFDMS